MNFGMDGPQVTGWWVNPQTGDKFNAVDTFFEDNNLLIKTSDGRLLNYNQIKNYIQTDRPESFTTPQKSKSQHVNEEIPAEILAEIDNGEGGEDSLLISDDNIYGTPTKLSSGGELGNIYNEPVKASVIKDFDIIDRALNSKTMPDFGFDVWWKDFPKREMEMLIEVLQIPESEIIDYYINKIVLTEVKDHLAKCIKDYIDDQLHPATGSEKVSEKEKKSDASGVVTKTTEVETQKKKTTTKKK